MKYLILICLIAFTTSCVSISKYKNVVLTNNLMEDSLQKSRNVIDSVNKQLYSLKNKIDSLNGANYYLSSDRDYFKSRSIYLSNRVDSLKDVVKNINKVDLSDNITKKEKVAENYDEFIEVSVDKMRDITFYESKRIINQTISYGLVYFYVYISKTKAGVKNLRLYTKYRGDDWIFYDKVYILGSNSSKTLVGCEYPQKQSDNDSEYIYEWSDNLLSKQQIALITKISEAETITIRFSGKYYIEFDLSEQQILGLREIINKYWTL